MMRRNSFGRSLILCLVLAIWASASSAALVEYSASLNGLTPITDGLLSVQKFNPTLGTLTGATFTLSGSVNSTLTVSANQNASTVTWEKLDYESLLGSGNKYFVSISGPVSMVAEDDYAGYVVQNASLNANEAGLFNAPILNATWEILFTDQLSEFVGSESLEFLLNANSFDSVFVTGNRPISIQTLYEGSIKVLYDYTPVPIPGAVLLLGTGLAGLVGLKRKFGKK